MHFPKLRIMWTYSQHIKICWQVMWILFLFSFLTEQVMRVRLENISWFAFFPNRFLNFVDDICWSIIHHFRVRSLCMGTSRFRKDTLSSSLNIRSSTALPLSSVSTGSGALSKLKWSLLNHSHMNVLLMDEYKAAQHHRPFQINTRVGQKVQIIQLTTILTTTRKLMNKTSNFRQGMPVKQCQGIDSIWG